MPEEVLPLCEDASQLSALDGRRVRLVGVYLPVPTLKKMPRPGRPRQEADLGEVVIQLQGEANAYDPLAPPGTPARIELGTSFRPPDEIVRLRARRVSVEGRLALGHGADRAAMTVSKRPAMVLLDPIELHPVE